MESSMLVNFYLERHMDKEKNLIKREYLFLEECINMEGDVVNLVHTSFQARNIARMYQKTTFMRYRMIIASKQNLQQIK